MEEETKELLTSWCHGCGKHIEVESRFDNEDGLTAMPTAYFTKEEYEKQFEEITGEKPVGVKKENARFGHLSYDDVGIEEAKKHLLQPVEYWVNEY